MLASISMYVYRKYYSYWYNSCIYTKYDKTINDAFKRGFMKKLHYNKKTKVDKTSFASTKTVVKYGNLKS